MQTFRACTGMLSSENTDFKFLKTAKKNKKHVHQGYHSYRARGFVLSLQTSLSLTRTINVKVAIELYYIFSKKTKFRYCKLFTDAVYISPRWTLPLLIPVVHFLI